MANFVTIEAEARERAGKGAARASRRAGKVPAVIYGAKQAATLIALDPRDVMRELTRGGWRSRVYQVNVDAAGGGGEPSRTLMREVQFHPVTDRPVHVDFQRLAPGARIRIRVPVAFLNEDVSPGLKAGGVLNVVRREIEVLAEPDRVPEKFEIDLAEAKIGDGLRWSSIKDNFGARPGIVGRDFMVASVAAPTVEAEAAPAAPTTASVSLRSPVISSASRVIVMGPPTIETASELIPTSANSVSCPARFGKPSVSTPMKRRPVSTPSSSDAKNRPPRKPEPIDTEEASALATSTSASHASPSA